MGVLKFIYRRSTALCGVVACSGFPSVLTYLGTDGKNLSRNLAVNASQLSYNESCIETETRSSSRAVLDIRVLKLPILQHS
jgi:hypothetical protein